MTPSCSAGLETAARLAGVCEGDEVIVPSFTFVSTASAVVRARGTPVFADIDPETLNHVHPTVYLPYANGRYHALRRRATALLRTVSR
jgi:dTDP-4-amino-4,6-dideoxygalactose transaminase